MTPTVDNVEKDLDGQRFPYSYGQIFAWDSCH